MIPVCIMAIENDDDRNFMAMIYEQYNRLMYREILKVLKNNWQAEDVLHNTIIRLIDKVDELKSKDHAHLINYIISASKNQALNYIRDNQKHLGSSFDECFDLPDENRSQEAMELYLIHVEDMRQLAVVWDKLDERSRYLLEGYYILEKTMPQLAAEMGMKTDSVRMALTRARKTAFQLMERKTVKKL